ncbi:Carbon-nitrogen hydrolase [Thoreauomyces humboldtii]|nr:Carbon-nitrogen hydrolase [Thoreauomyces humboldtii]
MRLACLQLSPELGQPTRNRSHADALLAELELKKGSVDLLILPEMCFSGYTFASREAVLPFAEKDDGETVQWAKRWAKALDATVQVGFPRLVPSEAADSPPILYNSVAIVGPTSVLNFYDKHFLFETDQAWASPGSSFRNIPTSLGVLGPGICMDLNPFEFEAPFDAYEYANWHLKHGTQTLTLSMAWILGEEGGEGDDGGEMWGEMPVQSSLRYWAMRMHPVVEADDPVIFACANRVGQEKETTFCGSSCVMVLGGKQITLLGALGRREEGVLLVDTEDAIAALH